MAILSHLFALSAWLRQGNRLFSIYTLFVIYSMFSNCGQSFLHMFTNQYFILNIYSMYNMEIICEMLKYQMICGAGLYLGTSIYVSKPYRNVSLNEIAEFYRLKEKSPKQVYYDALLFLCLAVVLYFSVYQLVLRQTMSYSELYESRENVSSYFAFGSILLGLNAILKKRHVKLVLTCWSWYLLAYFIAGTRSMGIIYAGALLFSMPILYPRIFMRKYYAFWAIGLLLGISVLSIISTLRMQEMGAISNETGLGLAFLNSINEMGISENPTIITMQQISRGHDYIQSILYNIILGFIPDSLLKMIVPASWTTSLGQWVNESADFQQTEWGYSWIAESYINYGQFGWIFTMVYGYFIAFAENYSLRKIKAGDYLLALCLISILCKQIFFARAQLNLFMTFYKPCIYIMFLWLIFGDKKRTKLKI